MRSTIKSLIVASILTFAGVAQVSADITLRYAEGGPNRGTRATAVQFFADEVERLSSGGLKIEIQWGGALLTLAATTDGMTTGSADLGRVLSSYEPQEFRSLGIGEIPLEYSDPWVGMQAMYDLMTTEPELKQSLADKSLVYLSNFGTTCVQFECTEGNPIRMVDDIEGKRLRATGTYSSVLADLEANMVGMPWWECPSTSCTRGSIPGFWIVLAVISTPCLPTRSMKWSRMSPVLIGGSSWFRHRNERIHVV